MKTFRFIFFLFSVSLIAAGFYACDGTTDPPAPSLAPSIVFAAPSYTSKNVDHYEDIVFNFTCTYNLNSHADLIKVKIIEKFAGGATQTLMDAAVPPAYTNSYTLQYIYTIPPTAPENQVITLTFSAEDKNGQVGSKVFTFTVKDLSDILEADLDMGAQSNTTYGSYFAADSNKIYKSAYAKLSANQARIDFVFVYDESGNGECIAAPNDPIVSDQTVDLCGSFATANKNATKFKPIPPMTDSAYNKIRTTAAITLLFNNAAGSGFGSIKSIVDGSGGTDATIIVFKTVGNQYGITKIKEIILEPGGQGTKNALKLNVKVSKK